MGYGRRDSARGLKALVLSPASQSISAFARFFNFPKNPNSVGRRRQLRRFIMPWSQQGISQVFWMANPRLERECSCDFRRFRSQETLPVFFRCEGRSPRAYRRMGQKRLIQSSRTTLGWFGLNEVSAGRIPRIALRVVFAFSPLDVLVAEHERGRGHNTLILRGPEIGRNLAS